MPYSKSQLGHSRFAVRSEGPTDLPEQSSASDEENEEKVRIVRKSILDLGLGLEAEDLRGMLVLCAHYSKHSVNDQYTGVTYA